MIAGRAPLIGWGAFFGFAIIAGLLGMGWQFAFAGCAIGLLGLPHGASDWAVVAAPRRASFLAAYLGCILGVLLLWRADPVLALAMLLALSVVHFAWDGAPEHGAIEGWSLGLFLVGAPALFHPGDVTALFDQATGNAVAATVLARTLQAAGALSTAMLVRSVLIVRRPGAERLFQIAAMAATLALPPLVGFAAGFVLLHARGQTVERQRAIGCDTLAAYLRQVLPLMVGAFAVLAAIAVWTVRGHLGHATFLFAGIAALATPHMLVTPLWRRPWRLRADDGSARHRRAFLLPAD